VQVGIDVCRLVLMCVCVCAGWYLCVQVGIDVCRLVLMCAGWY